MDMNSVERMTEYTHIETEADNGDIAPVDWPSKGDMKLSILLLVIPPIRLLFSKAFLSLLAAVIASLSSKEQEPRSPPSH